MEILLYNQSIFKEIGLRDLSTPVKNSLTVSDVIQAAFESSMMVLQHFDNMEWGWVGMFFSINDIYYLLSLSCEF